jgi:hypothetical protein
MEDRKGKQGWVASSNVEKELRGLSEIDVNLNMTDYYSSRDGLAFKIEFLRTYRNAGGAVVYI